MGSIVNGVREHILYSFALNSPPGHKVSNELKIKRFRKMNRPVLFQNIIHLQDDDYKPDVFNIEMVSSTCQLIEI